MMTQDEREILLQKFAEANRSLMAVRQQLEAANKKLKEYEEKTAKAEKASKMKSLNAIEGFSRVMAETDSQEERMDYMEIIESNNTRLLSLINEILDLSRVESGEIVLKNAPTDLNKLMLSIRNLFKFRCPDSVSLRYEVPSMPATMKTDENRITQVFSNLISNALKHTSKGSLTYGYRLTDEGQQIEFFVKDTGSGIAPEFIGHIFETYASRDAEQQKGYGLGLALCRIIVERMGGHISVQSTLGTGSTFTFSMPFHGTTSFQRRSSS